MRRATLFLLTALTLIFVLTSCKTVQVAQKPEVLVVVEEAPEAEPALEPEVVPEVVEETTEEPAPEEPAVAEELLVSEPEIVEEPVPEVLWTVGEIGPYGGLVFECDGVYLEMGEPFYDVSNFDASIALVAELAAESGVMYRLPTIVELTNLYDQLVLSGIDEDIEWTYYWSCEEVDEASAKVMNFDTGFEGQFYKSMDFLGVIPVVEL